MAELGLPADVRARCRVLAWPGVAGLERRRSTRGPRPTSSSTRPTRWHGSQRAARADLRGAAWEDRPRLNPVSGPARPSTFARRFAVHRERGRSCLRRGTDFASPRTSGRMTR